MMEHRLQTLRPIDLPRSSPQPEESQALQSSFIPDAGLPPVPMDEWDRESSTPRPVQVTGKGRGQSNADRANGSLGGERRSGNGSFVTPPSSWQRQSQGRMPSTEGASAGLRTEGPCPASEARQPMAEPRSEIEKSLEEEMFQQLWDENVALKQELENRKRLDNQCGTVYSWSAVSSVEQPVQTTPRKRTTATSGELRYTPGGTQVPTTTPPRDENGEVPKPPALIPVPPFPIKKYYEKVEASGHEGRTMQLGAKGWSPTVNQWTEWQLREAAKEIQRRAMQPDLPRPRTSVVDDNPSWGQVKGDRGAW